MKKARNLLLLGLSAALLIGCSNNGNYSSQSIVSSSETSEPSSSSEEPPLPPEPGDYDVTYPIEDTDVKPIDPNDFNVIINNALGTEYSERIIREFLGSKAFDALLNCNYVKEEQLSKFFGMMVDITSSNGTPELSTLLDLVNQLDELDMDQVVLTLRAVKANEDAYTGLAVLNRNGPRLLTGEYISYESVDEYLDGTNPSIHAAALAEKEVSKSIFSFDEAWLYDGLFELAADDGMLSFFRFLGHFATTLKTYMEEDEIEFLISSLGGEAYKERFEELKAKFLSSPEALLPLVNHAGQMFTNMNLSVDSWTAVIPAIEKFVILMTKNNDYDDESPWLESNTSNLQAVLTRFFTSLRPVAVKALFKFIGLIGENCTIDIINAAFGDPSVPLTTLSTFYNRMFGLLTETEKNNVDEAFFTLGVDIAKFNTDLEAAAETGDIEQVEAVAAAAFAPLGTIFDYDREYIGISYSNNRSALIFRQGDTINTATFKNILSDEDFYSFMLDGKYDIPSMRSYILLNSIDTSTPGAKELRFKATMKFESDTPGTYFEREKNFMVMYYVIPSSVEYICFSTNLRVYHGSDQIYNEIPNTFNGKTIQKIGDRVLVEQGTTFSAGEFKASPEFYGTYMYSAENHRFVSSNSHLTTEVSSFTVDFQSFDTSSVGSYFATGSAVYKIGDQNIAVAAYVPYEVVHKIASISDVEPSLDF